MVLIIFSQLTSKNQNFSTNFQLWSVCIRFHLQSCIFYCVRIKLFNQYIKTRETKYGRHFFINKKYHGCPGDEGWLVVTDTNGSKPCTWEQQKPYPQFMYGMQGKQTIWNDMSKILSVEPCVAISKRILKS